MLLEQTLCLHLLMEKGVMERMSVATAPTLAASEAPYARYATVFP